MGDGGRGGGGETEEMNQRKKGKKDQKKLRKKEHTRLFHCRGKRARGSEIKGGRERGREGGR